MLFNFSSKPNRRFMARMSISVMVFITSVLAGKHLLGGEANTNMLTWILATLPGLAMMGIFYAYGMLIIEQKDEFIRMLVVRQLIIATGIALSFATVWGFLESFGLVQHIFTYYVAVAWIVGAGIGAVVNKITHGAWGEMS